MRGGGCPQRRWGLGMAPRPTAAPNTTARREFKALASDEHWARDPGAQPQSLFAETGLRVPAILYNSGLNLYEYRCRPPRGGSGAP
jgi:hypothetical protein